MKRHREIMMVKMANKSNWLWLMAVAGLLNAGQVAAMASCKNQDPAEAQAEGTQAVDTQGAGIQDPEKQAVPDIAALKPSVLTEPPPRKLTVKEQAEPWSGQVLSSTPLLREKKYVAVLQIAAPRLQAEQLKRVDQLAAALGDRSLVPIDSKGLPFVGGTVDNFGKLNVMYFGIDVHGAQISYRTVSKSAGITNMGPMPTQQYVNWIGPRQLFEPVVRQIPESQRPSTASLEFIFRTPNDGLIASDLFEKLQQGESLPRMLFYVASPAEAREVANAWMTLVDYAITYPAQQELWARWQAEWERGADLQEDLAVTTRRLAEATAALAGREPVPKAVIESIAQRRYNVEIDLQGVRARHEAIRAAMEDRLNGGLVTRLLELQVEAQVELHGLESQLRLMEKMIAEQQEIGQLQRRIDGDERASRQLRASVNQLPWELEALRLASEILRPLEVVDNEIQLYPIAWPE
jgi:hypothetical protein